MAPAEYTNVSINGERETLVFGNRYRVRYGKDDTVLSDVRLDRRLANGDLLFVDETADFDPKAGPPSYRVRPSTIDAIFGSGVDHSAEREANVVQRRDGESAGDLLARLEGPVGRGGLGAAYTRWTGTDYGQKILAEAASEDQVGRRPQPETPRPLATEDVLVDPPKIPKRVAAKVLRDAANAVTEEDVAEAKPKSAGRPYSERNQVWRCGICKRRTRVPVCTGPVGQQHEPVAAPAGKRRDDR